MLVTKKLTVANDFLSRKKINYMEVNVYHQLSGYCQALKKKIVFCVRQKKEIQLQQKQLKGEQMMTEFLFLGDLFL